MVSYYITSTCQKDPSGTCFSKQTRRLKGKISLRYHHKSTYEPSPRWIYFQLESQMDFFTFLLEIGQIITICA